MVQFTISPLSDHSMLIANPHASRIPYPSELQQILNIRAALESGSWLAHWSLLNPGATPVYHLPGLAAKFGVRQLWVKDESCRSQVGSFKALGAPIALVRLMLRLLPGNCNVATLFSGGYSDQLADLTVTSATDGNHGRALAAAAQSVGCRCVIVLHAGVSPEREQAIAAYGAKIVRISGNYDESVERTAQLAAENSWYVVSDTSYTGYEDIPRDVMQGYAIIAAEIIEQTGSSPDAPPFTHVLLQGGVGGFAAGVFSYLWEYYGENRPRLLVVEPQQADCLYQSALQGRPARATGSVDSVMAGLACGECSPLAWKILQPSVDAFLTIRDDDAVQAMKILAEGNSLDIPVVAGESGAAGLAGLMALVQEKTLKRIAGIDHGSRILLVNTEGATSPAIYHELVGEPATAVLARQKICLQIRP